MLKIKHEGTGNLFYATKESAGFDICANENTEIPPGEWRLVSTGLRIVESAGVGTLTIQGLPVMVLPEIQLRPRSGLAAKNGITILNAPSTIDADYRGEIKVNLINHSKVSFVVNAGDRIAQGVCALIFQADGIFVKDTERGSGGFGSTGTN